MNTTKHSDEKTGVLFKLCFINCALFYTICSKMVQERQVLMLIDLCHSSPLLYHSIIASTLSCRSHKVLNEIYFSRLISHYEYLNAIALYDVSYLKKDYIQAYFFKLRANRSTNIAQNNPAITCHRLSGLHSFRKSQLHIFNKFSINQKHVQCTHAIILRYHCYTTSPFIALTEQSSTF